MKQQQHPNKKVKMPGLFDGFVAINQLPKNNESFAAYILTRPFDLTTIRAEHANKIYTTINLKWGMIYNEEYNVMEKVTAIMDSGVSYSFDLPNGRTLTICSYALNTFTLKVMILFEYDNMYSVYYDGHIQDPKIIFSKPKLWDLIKSDKIDQLLLDTTSICIKKFKITETAFKKIFQFLITNEGYQINLILEEFGHEDLLAELVSQGVKIFLDPNRNKIFKRNGPKKPKFCEIQSEADIFISNKMPPKTFIFRRFQEHKIATVAFCTDLDYEKEKMSSGVGLFYIEYTPHQTFPDAFFLAEIIAPKEIVPIQSDAIIPSRLKEFCRC